MRLNRNNHVSEAQDVRLPTDLVPRLQKTNGVMGSGQKYWATMGVRRQALVRSEYMGMK